MQKEQDWVSVLSEWADTHNISHKVFPREKEALLNLAELDLSSPELYSRASSAEELLEAIATQLDGEKPKSFSIPEEIGYLQNMKRLEVNLRGLKYLPRSIGALTNLEVLNVAHNDLRGLPREIQELRNLKSLDVRGNELVVSYDQKLWFQHSVKRVMHDKIRITFHDCDDKKMDEWGIKNEYVSKPKKCPACKQERVAPLRYGYPTEEAFESGKYFIGGCTIKFGRRQYSWACLDCEFGLYKKEDMLDVTLVSE